MLFAISIITIIFLSIRPSSAIFKPKMTKLLFFSFRELSVSRVVREPKSIGNNSTFYTIFYPMLKANIWGKLFERRKLLQVIKFYDNLLLLISSPFWTLLLLLPLPLPLPNIPTLFVRFRKTSVFVFIEKMT